MSPNHSKVRIREIPEPPACSRRFFLGWKGDAIREDDMNKGADIRDNIREDDVNKGSEYDNSDNNEGSDYDDM